jgi:hypothetical protein
VCSHCLDIKSIPEKSHDSEDNGIEIDRERGSRVPILQPSSGQFYKKYDIIILLCP